MNKTLEEIPRRFKIIKTVREEFTRRHCEKISRPRAPFHATPRGFIGPQLLTTILFDKFGMHIPLTAIARFKCEGIDLPLLTLPRSGWPRDLRRHAALPPDRSSCARCRASAWRRHHHPIHAKGKYVTGRVWAYVRDDRRYRGPAPTAAVYYASSDRRGEHPQKHLIAFTGILRAHCYSGFKPLFDPQKKVPPIMPPFCFAHAWRGFFELADIEKNASKARKGTPMSPMALEAVRHLDALLEIERATNGCGADERRAVRQEKSKPLLDDMHA